MIPREHALASIEQQFRVHPTVAVVGARQCGKTTLSQQYAVGQSEVTFYDLERVVDRRRLERAETVFMQSRGLVVLDEIQRMPHLFEVLRVVVDRIGTGTGTRFLLLGSATPELVRGVSESLAGRVGYVDLGGLSLRETGSEALPSLWLRGGFPRSFLAPDDATSYLWREGFSRSFLERDIPQLGIQIPSETLRRFWTMVAHYHGQVWNASEFARSLGANEGTARRYLDILVGAYMVRVLPPWFENLKKRQVRSPKIYIRDSGILHFLLNVESASLLAGHPKVGASWEGFVIEQLLDAVDARDAYFWGTHGGAELDLFLTIAGRRYGFECKLSEAPSTTRSMHVALQDLALDHVFVMHAGRETYQLDSRITAVPASGIPTLLAALQTGAFTSRLV